jgi:hypothetical protein
MKLQAQLKFTVLAIGLLFFIACGSKNKKNDTQTEQDSIGQTQHVQIPGEEDPDELGPRDASPIGKEQIPTIEELFANMDLNDDGKLSESEVKGPLKDEFTAVDTNNDSFLSKKK